MKQVKDKQVLLTAFRNSSAELLIKDVKQYDTLLLPNDKIRDSEMLVEAMTIKPFTHVVSIGQRPNIKDKVHVETLAKQGGVCISTTWECERLVSIFKENSIVAQLSHNAGTSYCNQLYFNGLQHISEKKMETKMVFIHIPFLKNLSDFDAFRRKFLEVLREL